MSADFAPIQKDCDRVVREALQETDQRKQLAMLLRWIVEKGQSGELVIVPPLDKMLGIEAKKP